MMGNIQNALKVISKNGMITEGEALKAVEKYEKQFDRITELLTTIRPHHGLFIGGDIDCLLAELRGRRFNAAEYNYNKEPDGQ